jgi:hypothetical protein
MSSIYDLVGGGFAHMTAPYAVHPLDRQRAAEYLSAALKANIQWHQAKQDIQAYLASQGCTPEQIEEEVVRAAKFLEPWLT